VSGLPLRYLDNLISRSSGPPLTSRAAAGPGGISCSPFVFLCAADERTGQAGRSSRPGPVPRAKRPSDPDLPRASPARRRNTETRTEGIATRSAFLTSLETRNTALTKHRDPNRGDCDRAAVWVPVDRRAGRRTKHRDPNRGDCDPTPNAVIGWRNAILDETPRPEPRGLRPGVGGAGVGSTGERVTKHRDPNRGDCDPDQAVKLSEFLKLKDETPRPEPRGLRRTRLPRNPQLLSRLHRERRNTETRTEGIATKRLAPARIADSAKSQRRNTETRTEGIATKTHTSPFTPLL
jgi:hypothetical protein